MNYIRITKENIDREHICCAMSGKQSIAKKEWLRQRFEEGLVFYRSEERGKCMQPVSRLSGAGGGEGTPVSFMAVVLPILWHSGPLKFFELLPVFIPYVKLIIDCL